MTLSQQILNNHDISLNEVEDYKEKTIEERDKIIKDIKDRILKLEVDMAHMQNENKIVK